MPDQTTPCGLRTRHNSHPYGDNDADWCDGKQPPEHYDARHRGRYRPELGWWPVILAAVVCKHRLPGDPVIAEEPHYPRSHLRLRWRDRSLSNADTGSD